MSALYQYHNAPEVAPAHGLEYDDSNSTSFSDKYPVVHTRHFDSSRLSKNGFNNDRPPRIIFGMKVRTFLMVAAVIVCILVGAAVGGAVGGKSMRENHASQASSSADDNDDAIEARYAMPLIDHYRFRRNSNHASQLHHFHPISNPVNILRPGPNLHPARLLPRCKQHSLHLHPRKES